MTKEGGPASTRSAPSAWMVTDLLRSPPRDGRSCSLMDDIVQKRPPTLSVQRTVLSRRWYILLLPQDYLLLPLEEWLVADGSGVEERSEVMYWHREAYIIYYRNITCHSCIA